MTSVGNAALSLSLCQWLFGCSAPMFVCVYWRFPCHVLAPALTVTSTRLGNSRVNAMSCSSITNLSSLLFLFFLFFFFPSHPSWNQIPLYHYTIPPPLHLCSIPSATQASENTQRECVLRPSASFFLSFLLLPEPPV